jgi:hypothetical protein
MENGKYVNDMKVLFNLFGISSNATALYLNIGEWLFSVSANKWLTIVISVLAIIWWLMKMYDQYLITRKRKKGL